MIKWKILVILDIFFVKAVKIIYLLWFVANGLQWGSLIHQKKNLIEFKSLSYTRFKHLSKGLILSGSEINIKNAVSSNKMIVFI